MQKKTIKIVLSKKIKDWANSIDDEEVKKAIEKNVIVTGGSIVSMFLKESPKDYDVYFKTKESLKIVAQYYLDKFKKINKNSDAKLLDGSELDEQERIIYNMEEDRLKIFISSKGVESENNEILDQPFEDIYDVLNRGDQIDGDELEKSNKDKDKEKYRPIFLSSNAITLSDKIQIIVRFYGSPEEIHENYDFIHCTNYWTSWDNKIVTNLLALESILEKRLYYIGSKYPVCSIIRMRKFIKRGWEINAGQILKMIMNANIFDLTYPKVLEDQLIGVDSAYFNKIIKAIKDKLQKDPKFKIDNCYIFSIIDRIF